MMEKTFLYILFIFIGFLFSTCEDKLEVPPPNSLTDEMIQDILRSGDENKINLVLGSMAEGLDHNFKLNDSYSGFSNNPLNPLTNQDLWFNLMGNDIVLGEPTLGTSGIAYQIFYNMDPAFEPWRADDRSYNYTWWKLAATPHTNANKVLDYLDEETVEESGSKLLKDYRARALTVRAYGYMLLMERYQKAYLHGGKDGKGMPIYTTYGENPPVEPASATDTYNFIKDNLTEAAQLFSESEIGDNGFTTNKPNDIDRGVALFLLARVYLWTGEYENCITAAEEILEHYPNFIREEYYGIDNSRVNDLAEGKDDVKANDNAFSSLDKNPETILGWVDGNGAQTYQFGNFNCFLEGDGGLGQYYMRIDDRLFEKIDDSDYRKDRFLVEPLAYTYPTNHTVRTIPKYTNLKWGATIAKQHTERNNKLNCDHTYFRSSEVLLMLAEAQALNNQEGNAKNTLNRLLAARTKSGRPALTCDTYSSMKALSVLEMIKLQWRIEMWGENGLDFYNSKRWNQDVDRNGSEIHWSAGKIYTVEQMTYEIPIQETSTNPLWSK
jgi:tetratricopeptide (TPR) repeat protein